MIQIFQEKTRIHTKYDRFDIKILCTMLMNHMIPEFFIGKLCI
jgi:hypothetical protein